MSVFEFYSLTPRELAYAMKDYADQFSVQLELFVKTSWEVARTTLLHIYAQNPNIKRPPKKVTQIMNFPWDKTEAPKQMSVEEMRKALEAIHAVHGNKKRKRGKS